MLNALLTTTAIAATAGAIYLVALAKPAPAPAHGSAYAVAVVNPPTAVRPSPSAHPVIKEPTRKPDATPLTPQPITRPYQARPLPASAPPPSSASTASPEPGISVQPTANADEMTSPVTRTTGTNGTKTLRPPTRIASPSTNPSPNLSPNHRSDNTETSAPANRSIPPNDGTTPTATPDDPFPLVPWPPTPSSPDDDHLSLLLELYAAAEGR